MPVHACTIIAGNYLPLARVLAATFLGIHPDGHMTVLIFDDVEFARSIDGEAFDVLSIADLGDDELFRMAVLYDITEFATSVKPWLLERLLRDGAPSVLYLDPDIQVFAPLDELSELAATHDIVLTPHATRPMPRDGKMTTETSILAAGIYNLGFIGVGTGALAGRSDGSPSFIAYWKARLLRECVNDPQGMRFVDQRWIDFVPAVFEPAIVHTPDCNVAYWNLDHRDVQWDGGSYTVDGSPLRFFHFSGYRPDQPHLLSKHQGEPPRILLSERPVVRRLCDEYQDLLLEHGWEATDGYEYPFDSMANGVPVDQYVRKIYRDGVELADAGEDEYPPLPWNEVGAEALCDWLRSPPRVHGDPGNLSVYLATVFGVHVHELRLQFFDPQGADREGFLAWAGEEAEGGRLAAALVGPVADGGQVESSRWAPGTDLRPGVLVAGYLRAELGVGEGARLLVSGLEAASVEFSTYDFGETVSRQEHSLPHAGTGVSDLDIVVLCINADQVPVFATSVGPEFFDGRYVIGQWAWELEEFPTTWDSAFDQVDEIWAVSEFSRRAIGTRTNKPVFAVPHPIVRPIEVISTPRPRFGLPTDRTVFLFCFDLLSGLERKNPLGLIEAYGRAFPGESESVLVLKVINGDRAVAEMERIRYAAGDRSDIVIIDRYLDEIEQASLMDSCDCYVSLHRSEGFGLTMAEAMASGKPVIATAYSGNLDFMDDATAYLVPWEPGVVPPGCDPYRAGARWAEPNLDAAARLMRTVRDRPDEARAVGIQARDAVAASHGPDARARFLRRRIDQIERLLVERRHVVPDPGVHQVLEPARGTVQKVVVRLLASERVMRVPRAAVRGARSYLDPR